jgi:hypothetical protein
VDDRERRIVGRSGASIVATEKVPDRMSYPDDGGTPYPGRGVTDRGVLPAAEVQVFQRRGRATGRWEGNVLVARTTHMQVNFLRKTGVPLSDQTTPTTRFYRHGDILTVLAIIEDPLHLAEPQIITKTFRHSTQALSPVLQGSLRFDDWRSHHQCDIADLIFRHRISDSMVRYQMLDLKSMVAIANE